MAVDGDGLLQKLPAALDRAVASNLAPGEEIEVALNGAFKEALICTDKRVMIVKAGFMTGQLFGSNVFQLPYTAVSGVEVKWNLLSGYFELSAPGMQNRDTSYWKSGKGGAVQSPNCVSFTRKETADRFRRAGAFIMDRVQRRTIAAAPRDGAAEIEHLWQLHQRGALTAEEFADAKASVISARR